MNYFVRIRINNEHYIHIPTKRRKTIFIIRIILIFYIKCKIFLYITLIFNINIFFIKQIKMHFQCSLGLVFGSFLLLPGGK